MDSRLGAAGRLSATLPNSPPTVFPPGGHVLSNINPDDTDKTTDLNVTGASDLMMPHAIGVGMGLNTESGFLKSSSGREPSEIKANPLFEIGSDLANFLRPGTLSRQGSKGEQTPFSAKEVEKRLAGIAKSLDASRSAFQAASACRRLTSVVRSTPSDVWEAPLKAHGIVKLLMPHPLVSEVSLSHAASQALAILTAAATESTLVDLLHAGSVGVVCKVAMNMLDSTSRTPEDISSTIALLLRAGVLPILRCPAAAEAAVTNCTDDLETLAQTGRCLLQRCSPGQHRAMAHVQGLLAHLQCTHALLVSAPPTAVVPAQRSALLRCALDAYELAHHSSTPSAYAWELRKACAVLEVLGAAFQRLEDDIMGGSDGPACATSRRTLAVDAVQQTVTGDAAAGPQHLLGALLGDVRLRDRPTIAAMALQGLHVLLVHCSVPVADLAPTHIVAVAALADVWQQMGLVQPYCELLMHFWCESAALSREVKMRLRALVCRTLGRLGGLASDTLTFIRQHVVPHCVKWLDWETSPAFAYSLRSFASQDREIRKTLITGGFIDAVAFAAARGEPIAADVLLDLAAAHGRIARHAARAAVLSATPVLLSVASSPARAERGILAIAQSSEEATRDFCESLPEWIQEAAAGVGADEGGLEAGARMLRMSVACAEAGGELHDAIRAVPSGPQLVLDVVEGATDVGDVAAAIAAAARINMPQLLLQRLCKGALTQAVRRIPANRAAELLQAFEGTAAVLEGSDAQEPSPAGLMLAAALQPQCVAAIYGLLTQWDQGALDAAYGGGWLEVQTQAPAADQQFIEARMTSGGRRKAMLPGTAASFVDQVGAMHAAARVALMLTQEASSAAHLADPAEELDAHLMSVMDLVEANCKDMRLRRLLEAAALMIKAVKERVAHLRESGPAEVKPPATVLGQFASALNMWPGQLRKPPIALDSPPAPVQRHEDTAKEQAAQGSGGSGLKESLQHQGNSQGTTIKATTHVG